MEFREAVAAALRQNSKLAEKLAQQFGCSATAPIRWANGSSVPHPDIQKVILEFIRNQ
jgi:hypothetical protein